MRPVSQLGWRRASGGAVLRQALVLVRVEQVLRLLHRRGRVVLHGLALGTMQLRSWPTQSYGDAARAKAGNAEELSCMRPA